MGPASHSRPHHWQRVMEAVLVAVSLLVGYLFIEFAYRGYLYYTYAVMTDFMVATTDVRSQQTTFGLPGSIEGRYPPNTVFTLTLYNDNRIVDRHGVHINNLGWVSQYDYERSKAPDEYRIAIVGDSMTASVNNEIPWPDLLQRELNADTELLAALGVKRITIINLGIAGASMQFMANPLAVIARRFTPDLLVTNFVLDDLARRHGAQFEDIPPEPAAPPPPSTTPVPVQPDLVIDGVEINLLCPSGAQRSVSNPDCHVNPEWYVPPGRNISSEEMTKLKRSLAQRLLWHRVLLTMKPLVILEVIGQAVIPRAQAGEFAPLTRSNQEDEDVDIGLRALRVIQRLHPNHLVTHNPVYYYMTRAKRPVLLDRFLSLVTRDGIDIVEMEDHMPIPRDDRERNRWFNLPHDGHWSDYGAEVYAQAMSRVIRKRLLAARGLLLKSDENPCATSYGYFRDGRVTMAKGDAAAAATAFSEAVASLPATAYAFARQGFINYADCGFLADLYAERAALRETQGEAANAVADWKAAFDVALDPTPIYQRRIALRRAKKDLAGVVSDLGQLIALHPEDADLYIARGDAHLAAGDARQALADFIRVQQYRPKDAGLLFRLSQVRIVSGEYADAIRDMDEALVLMPGTAGFLFTRANAKAALEQWNGALTDFTAAIAAMPDQAAFYSARASMFDRLGRKAEAEADRKKSASLK